ncbi:formate dehydrogenase accessory sulfurtransferase FdhD [Thermodesulfobacteriota bacterium]
MQTAHPKPDRTAKVSSKESFDVIRCHKGDRRASEQELIGEEPLLIRVDGRPYSAVMRTPGEETFLAAGFCLAEGIVDDVDDFASVGYCEDMDPNVVDIRLQPSRLELVSSLLERQGFISQTSCGICGKMMIEEMFQFLKPFSDNTGIDFDDAIRSTYQLPRFQRLYKSTRGSHAVTLLDSRLKILSVAEDVGRHNALDKAIGKLLMSKSLKDARIGVLTSRISYEMVQKAARAELPILLSKSYPTTLAVRLAKELNLTLACADTESELIIFCGEERINNG